MIITKSKGGLAFIFYQSNCQIDSILDYYKIIILQEIQTSSIVYFGIFFKNPSFSCENNLQIKKSPSAYLPKD